MNCPHCGSKHIHQNKIYARTVKGIPLHPGCSTLIKTSVRSFECQECKKVFSENVPVPEVHPLDGKPAFVKIGRKSAPECDGNSEGQVKLSMSFRNESIFEIAIDVSQLRELLKCI